MDALLKHVLIKDTDDFHTGDFPHVVKELAEIKQMIKPLWHVDNKIIIISYLKDHMIRSDLAQSHPQLVQILTSKNTCRFLEDLFLSSRGNTGFRLSLENYIEGQLHDQN